MREFYRNEFLPYCLIIGITEEQFWHMNPRMFEPYYQAEKLRHEKRDNYLWMMGSYVYEGVATALSNMFHKRGQKIHEFRDKPYTYEIKENRGELPQDEVVKKTEILFQMLTIKQKNFELEKKLSKIHDTSS